MGQAIDMSPHTGDAQASGDDVLRGRLAESEAIADLPTRTRRLLKLYVEARDNESIVAEDIEAKLLALDRPPIRYLWSSARTMYGDEYPMLLVHRSKYGDSHFIVNDADGLAKACLKFIADNIEAGWYPVSWSLGPPKPYGAPREMVDLVMGQIPIYLSQTVTSDSTPTTIYRTWDNRNAVLSLMHQTKDIPWPIVLLERLSELDTTDPGHEIAFVAKTLADYGKAHQGSDYGDVLRSLNAYKNAESLYAKVVRACSEEGARVRASKILGLAADGHLRKAGREALDLLTDRSGHEYERFKIERVSQPEIDLRKWKISRTPPPSP
jgi:hypothetical protein